MRKSVHTIHSICFVDSVITLLCLELTLFPMDEQENIALFQSLHAINDLISAMAEVATACLTKAVKEGTSILLKNLLVDNYISRLSEKEKETIVLKRNEFKDWLTERVNCLRENEVKVSLVKDEESNSTKTSLKIPLSDAFSLVRPSRLRRFTYSLEVFVVFVPDDDSRFERAASLFSDKYVCNVRSNSILIHRDRCRRTSESLTQSFTCSCCTSELVLQFRRMNQPVVGIPPNGDYPISAFIKPNMLSTLNQHFSKA
jgi:hypothetical protein